MYFSPHVDIISLGCITQGCPVVDFSLKVQKPVADSTSQEWLTTPVECNWCCRFHSSSIWSWQCELENGSIHRGITKKSAIENVLKFGLQCQSSAVASASLSVPVIGLYRNKGSSHHDHTIGSCCGKGTRDTSLKVNNSSTRKIKYFTIDYFDFIKLFKC